MRGRSRTVYFATTNKGKFFEAAKIASGYGIRLKRLDFEKHEIQSNSLMEIASFAAQQAAKANRCAVVAEDAGFFVDAFGGFPGPYSSYVFKTLGTRGILKLMMGERNRGAFFQAAVAYCAPRAHPRSFQGLVKGVVDTKPKGNHGFGFDPIFVPSHDGGRTFAQMSADEKNALSHRAIAFSKFFRWFTGKRNRRLR